MTGAPVPEGADAIIMHERTSFTENTVTLTAPVTSANIIPPGEDVAAGTLLVPKGKILTASDLALIAGQGIAEIGVYKKLSIGLISTGSELLNTGSPLEYGKIYNTNPYLLGGYIQKHHMTANYLNTVSDDLDSLCRAVLEALGEITASPEVWLAEGGGYTPVDVTTPAAVVHRHAAVSCLEIEIRSKRKTRMPWN